MEELLNSDFYINSQELSRFLVEFSYVAVLTFVVLFGLGTAWFRYIRRSRSFSFRELYLPVSMVVYPRLNLVGSENNTNLGPDLKPQVFSETPIWMFEADEQGCGLMCPGGQVSKRKAGSFVEVEFKAKASPLWNKKIFGKIEAIETFRTSRRLKKDDHYDRIWLRWSELGAEDVVTTYHLDPSSYVDANGLGAVLGGSHKLGTRI